MHHRIDELFFLDLPVFYQERKDYIQRLNEIVSDKEKTIRESIDNTGIYVNF